MPHCAVSARWVRGGGGIACWNIHQASWVPKALKKWLLMGLNQVKVAESWLDLPRIAAARPQFYDAVKAEAAPESKGEWEKKLQLSVELNQSGWRLKRSRLQLKLRRVLIRSPCRGTWWRCSLGNLALIGVLAGIFVLHLFQWHTTCSISQQQQSFPSFSCHADLVDRVNTCDGRAATLCVCVWGP